MSESDPYAAPVTQEANPEIVSSFAPAGEPEELQAPVGQAPATQEAVTVPEGSIKEVLAWVGDDSVKAQQALQAEEAGEGRKTLVAKLNDIIK